MKNIQIQEIIDYKEGNKSAKLNMAIAYDMPYIAEKEMINATPEEKTLMVAELLSTYNGEQIIQFLFPLIRYEVVSNLVNNVSLSIIAKTMGNEIAFEYLNQYEVPMKGTPEEALEVINTFNNKEKVTKNDMLNFLLGEVKRIRK